MFAKKIINFDVQLIAAQTTQFPTLSPAQHQFAQHPPEPQPQTPQPIQLNDMAGILTEHPRTVPNLYWQPGQLIGAPVRNFRQIKYIQLPNAVPDLDQALSGARLDCGRDFHKQLIEFGEAAKVWMTVQVEYEPVNLIANKQPFKQYFGRTNSHVQTR